MPLTRWRQLGVGSACGVLAVALALSACGSTSSEVIVGSGNPVSRMVDAVNFDRIDLAGIGTVTAQPGRSGVTVRADDNIIDLVRVEVRNRVLVVDLVPGSDVQPMVPIDVVVSYEGLTGVELSGEGDLVVEAWIAEDAEIVLSGAGDVTVDVVAGSLAVSYPGAGSMTVSGEAAIHSLTKTGLGPYLAADLRTARTTLDASGIGDIEVWATAELTYDVTGQGQVRYWGLPTADGNISSQGGLAGMGEK